MLCVAAAMPSLAAVVDLGSGTVEITTADGLNTYKNNTVQNGVLNVSASQAFADGTFTFGYGLVINQTAGAWGTSGSRTVKIVDGCVVRYTSTEPVWFGRTHGGVTYNGTTQLILDNGALEGVTVSLIDKPEWVKGISVVDGDIVLDVKPAGIVVIIK